VWVTIFFLSVKSPWRDVNHSPLSTAEVRSETSYIYIQFSRRHTKTHADRNRYHSETAIDKKQQQQQQQQQHSCETLICQFHQTILRLLSSAALASTRWRVRELYCPTTYVFIAWSETILPFYYFFFIISLTVFLAH
jgi:hypothetical protein